MKDRLTELEIKISLTEDLLEELNRTVYRQQQQIDLLQAQLRHVYGQMQAGVDAAESSEPRNLRDEIPPHY
jgi:SlyX protein